MTRNGLYAERYSSGLRYLGSDADYLPQKPTRIYRPAMSTSQKEAVVALRRQANNYGVLDVESFAYGIYSSSDGFENTHSYLGTLKECGTVSGGTLASCSTYSEIHSAYPMAFANDDAIGRGIYAWADLDRGDASKNGDVRVAIGTIAASASITGPSFSLGVRSDTAPAIACKDGQAGGYDCMVAYTDVADPVNSVRFKRFSSGFSSNYFYPVVASGFNQISSSGWQRTASPLGLVYHNGKWRLSMKLALATGSGSVRVYSSTSGATDTWAMDGTYSYTSSGGGGTADATDENNIYFAN